MAWEIVQPDRDGHPSASRMEAFKVYREDGRLAEEVPLPADKEAQPVRDNGV